MPLQHRKLSCVLVIPAWTHRESHPTALRKLGAGFWTPLNLMYLASRIRMEHSVTILDGGFFTEESLLRRIRELNPSLVGFYVNTVLWNSSREQIAACRELLPDSHITVGGPLPTVIKEEYLENCPECDSLVVGEGEETLAELANRFAAGASLEGVAGTMYRRNGEIITNPQRPFIEDLDSLPSPAWDLIDIKDYVPPIGLYTKRPVVTALTSRGCHHKCIYCFKWGGDTIRFRSPEPVVEEMKNLVDRYGVKEIRYWDDTFSADKERVLAMSELVKKRGVKVDISIATRADALDREVLAALKKMGVYNIMIGVESGVQKNLDTLKKGETLEQIREAVKLTHEAGIRTFLTQIFGIPGETYEDGLKTIEFARSLKPDAAHFFTMCPFPGTELYKNLPKYGKALESDYSAFGMHTLSFEPHTLTMDEIEKLRRRAFLQTTIIPSFLLKRLLNIRSIEEVRILARAASTIFLALIPSLMKRLRFGKVSSARPTG